MKANEIINEILNYEDVNLNQLAKSIGLSRTQPLYDIRDGKIKRISEEYADKIMTAYPNYNRIWLLTGEGDMLKNTEPKMLQIKGIPLIDNMRANCGFVIGTADSAFMKDCVMIVLPDLVADFVIKATGHSMINKQDPTQTITDGALVACNRCSGKIIQWGDVYALVTVDGVFIKKLMPCEDEDYIICESFNEVNPPFKLYKELILDMAKVSKAFNTANF